MTHKKQDERLNAKAVTDWEGVESETRGNALTGYANFLVPSVGDREMPRWSLYFLVQWFRKWWNCTHWWRTETNQSEETVMSSSLSMFSYFFYFLLQLTKLTKTVYAILMGKYNSHIWDCCESIYILIRKTDYFKIWDDFRTLEWRTLHNISMFQRSPH